MNKIIIPRIILNVYIITYILFAIISIYRHLQSYTYVIYEEQGTDILLNIVFFIINILTITWISKLKSEYQ